MTSWLDLVFPLLLLSSAAVVAWHYCGRAVKTSREIQDLCQQVLESHEDRSQHLEAQLARETDLARGRLDIIMRQREEIAILKDRVQRARWGQLREDEQS